MAFCKSCGQEIGTASFCPKCGASQGVVATPVVAAASPTEGLQENVAGLLCYSLGWLTGIIFLLIEPYNRNKAIRFHAFQGLFLLAATIAVSIVMSVIASVIWGLVFLMPFINLIFVGIWIFLMFKTYSGERIVLPVIGPIAEKQA